MTDQPTYLIANLAITDPGGYQAYAQGFMPLLLRHGGELLAVDEKSETQEGSTVLTGRVVIVKFPTEAQARSWYGDADYQALCVHRRAASHAQFVTLVHGLPTSRPA